MLRKSDGALLRARFVLAGVVGLGVGIGGVAEARPGPVDLELLRGDLNGDGESDFDDILELIMLPAFGNPMPADRSYTYSEGDLNNDGLVNFDDADVILAEELAGATEVAIPAIPGVEILPDTTGFPADSPAELFDGAFTVADYYTPYPSTPAYKLMNDGLPVMTHVDHDLVAIWESAGQDTSDVDVSISLTSIQDDGFTMRVTWNNTSTTLAKDYGRIRLPFLMFGPQIRVRDFTRSSEERIVDIDDPAVGPETNLGRYPESKYSPCITIRGLVCEDEAPVLNKEDWPAYDGAEYSVEIGRDTSTSVDFADGWLDDWNAWAAKQPSLPTLPNPFSTTEPSTMSHDFREYVMGVSVHYPVLDYEFPVRFRLEPVHIEVSGTQDSIYWNLRIDPNFLTSEHEAGQLPVETERSLDIVVRFYRPLTIFDDHNPGTNGVTEVHRGQFLNLFREYRRYFKRNYGNVQHVRDTRPVKRVSLGNRNANNCADPDSWGYAVGPGYDDLVDPEGDGWELVAGTGSIFETFEDRGFERLLVNSISGNYCNSFANWPFRVVSRLEELAVWSVNQMPMPIDWEDHKILTTMHLLGDWQDDVMGREVGIWWGRSCEPTFPAPSLDPAEASPTSGSNITVDDPLILTVSSDEREAALDEIDKMLPFGASMLGLDQSTILPEYDRYHWLQILRHEARASWVQKLCTESYCMDFTHTLQPTYFQMTKENGGGGSGEVFLPNGPHELLDFLNQGAESWGAIGQSPTVDTLSDAEDVAIILAKRGFTLHIANAWDRDSPLLDPFDVDQNDDGILDGEFDADDAWLLTVPLDLQQP